MKEKSKVKIALKIIAFAGIVVTVIGSIIAAIVSKSVHVIVEFPPMSSSTSDSDDSSPVDVTPSDSSTIDSSKAPEYSGDDISTKLMLYADNQDGKWGYMDQFGNEIVPHIYDWADDFIDEYAAVYKDDMWGFIDKTGRTVIPFSYNGAWSFIDGLAPVFNGDKWGVIDKQGNIKIQFKYANIYRTYEGGNQVYTDENNNVINYNNEISNNSSSTGLSSSNSSIVVAQPQPVNYQVPIRDFLEPYVSATLTDSNLTLWVKREQAEQLNEAGRFPFRWGLHLYSHLGADKMGDYVIELELNIDSENTVLDTDTAVSVVTGLNEMKQVQKDITEVKAYFDGENFVISCDITNEYIHLDDDVV